MFSNREHYDEKQRSQQEIGLPTAGAAQKQHLLQQQEAEIRRLRTENKELEGTVREFRNETEALMTDYQGSADRLHETKSDRDKYFNQYETALRELAQRAERIKMLEQHRKEVTERNEHMSFQVSVWHSTLILPMK